MKRLWNTDLKVHRVLGVRMAQWGEDNNKTPGWTVSNLWMFPIVDLSLESSRSTINTLILGKQASGLPRSSRDVF